MTNNYVMRLPHIVQMMDFISEVSTLYEVENGPEFRLVASNGKAQASGVAPRALFGQLMSEFLPKAFYQNTLLPILKEVVASKQASRGEHTNPYPGSAMEMDFLVTPICDDDECKHIWVITRQRRTVQDLEYLSFMDELTSLSNRRSFFERLNKSFKRHKEQGIEFCIIMIDLNDFKTINDSFGHQFGDRLLKELARRMMSCVRDNDLIGRIGGDEFVILTEGKDAQASAHLIAERLLDRTQQPFNIRGIQLKVKLSIGITCVRDHENIESILSDADSAMYKAKLLDGTTYVVHE